MIAARSRAARDTSTRAPAAVRIVTDITSQELRASPPSLSASPPAVLPDVQSLRSPSRSRVLSNPG